jgi:acyl-CoA synthetase (NDP forming)
VPLLTPDSYKELSKFYNLVGGGYVNPIDTGNSNRAELLRIMDIIERDANIDNVVLLMGLGMGGGPQDPNSDSSPPQDRVPGGVDSVIALRKKTSKPVMAAVYSPFSTGGVQEARRVIKKLQDGGVPAFTSVERAATALKNALDYYHFKSKLNPQ